MDSLFDTKHLYSGYFKMAFPVVLGLVITLIYNLADTFFIAQIAALLVCVKFFGYNGVLMGQAAADVVSAVIAVVLLLCCNPMAQAQKEEPSAR